MASLFATTAAAGLASGVTTGATYAAAAPAVAAASTAATSTASSASILSGISAGLALGGTGIAALGNIQQGRAAAQQARSQAAVSEYNARVQEQQAQAEAQATQYKQRRMAEEQARKQSSLIAEIGMSGAKAGEGAPLMIQAKQAEQSEMDQLITGYESYLTQQRFSNQATLDRLQASIQAKAASNYETSGMIGAGSSLMRGLGEYGLRKYGL